MVVASARESPKLKFVILTNLQFKSCCTSHLLFASLKSSHNSSGNECVAVDEQQSGSFGKGTSQISISI